jgi:tripeptidyl-peptidase-2
MQYFTDSWPLLWFSIKAYDSSCPEKGAVFEVPVTVVKPETVHNEISYKKQHFAAGDIQRRFINVPEGASWAGKR